MMSFEKENPNPLLKRTVLSSWTWANQLYEFSIAKPKFSIRKITGDPSRLMADINQLNNTFEVK
jgi:hypothetical protein